MRVQHGEGFPDTASDDARKRVDLLRVADCRTCRGAVPLRVMTSAYDVIIAGLGAMGSLTAYQLARRGHRVFGFDRYTPPHAMGSSHGHSRIIREAYFEDPRYVPMVQAAYREWAALEAARAVTLFRQTGGLMLGSPDGVLVRGARRSAELHALPHEILDAAAVRDTAEKAMIQTNAVVAAVAPMVSRQGESVSRLIQKEFRRMAGM